MGVSTDGQICYGFAFGEDAEFPWNEEGENFGDIEDWWRKQQGINHAKAYPAEGWLEYRKEFDATHPIPVSLVNYCSGDYPMWILAVPSSCRTAYRGTPKAFEPSELSVTLEERAALGKFISDNNLGESLEGAKWYLSSYWG